MSVDPAIYTEKSRSIFVHAGWFVILSVLYWAIFLIPLPPQYQRQGVFLIDELIFLVLLAFVFLSFRYPSRGARYLRLGCILLAFTLPLLRLWETAESTWNIVLGMLPWADATDYYFDVNRLLQGGLFSAFSGRRPLFASLLASTLTLSHQNLQIALVIFTVITALVVFLLVEEVHHELGSVSAIVALYLSQLFYRPFAGDDPHGATRLSAWDTGIGCPDARGALLENMALFPGPFDTYIFPAGPGGRILCTAGAHCVWRTPLRKELVAVPKSCVSPGALL